MFGSIARLLLVRVLGRRLIPIFTVVELIQLVRRRRGDYRRDDRRPVSGRAPKRVGPRTPNSRST